ncbi:type I inositol polyphosphate 5-phosphatase 2 isoform X2 [Vigna radiata var. radiata]|uniref:Type I inositol polyphosphate 5-phosphatase 2 isoform X2 n=1 Tax=Vigna radiata var. radiata TaxID=3916 RepID=A0A3Q0F5B3_VIGRR|nr:type I inositol polyphosphate 5-phosphatase 2 isoform X2 [Vigna radiata var. radiata]
MKTRRGRRSEAFWPSLVMKKWLNIKPKVYDFSEDEVDTETESEDDVCSLKDSRMGVREDNPLRTPSILFPSQTSDASCKGYNARHRRGKSETLRVQYINTKEVRVTIGTWNVAGRLPCKDLEIEDWLCTNEPADIYIIGFQEVVPLNAGNVLGAEDNTPIRNWEAIIRRTLNKSSEPESKPKSYSAPSSPVLRASASASADVLADSIDVNPLDTMNEEYMGSFNKVELQQEEVKSKFGIGRNLQFRKIKDIDPQTILYWPERPLDSVPDTDSSSKLRRVWSSDRIGFNQTEKASKYGSVMKRTHHSSGNLGLLWKEQQVMPEEVIDSLDELSDEEDDAFLELPNDNEDNGIGAVKSHRKYVRIVSKQMVGIYVSIWVQRRLRKHINNLKVSPVGVGLMGYMGNKGSVSVSMSLFQSRLCFVCSHLTSGQKDGAEIRRNSDVHEILRRTRFSSVFDTDQPQTIPSHECDRILWLGKGIKQLEYKRTENKLSDHRPVSSIFSIDVEVFDQRKLQRALNFTSSAVHPEVFLKDDGEWSY